MCKPNVLVYTLNIVACKPNIVVSKPKSTPKIPVIWPSLAKPPPILALLNAVITSTTLLD